MNTTISPPPAHVAYQEFAKVPAVTLGFWLIKILATTLGETAGDAVTMSMNLGYLAGTAHLRGAAGARVGGADRGRRASTRCLFWAVIVATTTVGTTLADLCDRSLGIGYLGRLDAAVRRC